MRRGSSRRALFQAVLALAVVGAALGAAPVSVEAQSEGSGYFSDDDGSVHEPALNALAEQGVLAGIECGEGLICPGKPLKRWEMAVWLVRVLDGAGPARVDASRFTDVDADQWWAPFVERLYELRVTAGCATEPVRFCPEQSVTRAQMATFLERAFDLEPADAAGFGDVSGGPHASNIDALAAAGITGGCSRDPLRYCPANSVTRAQMATFLARALGLVELPASVRFIAIDAGYGHTCGLRADQTVACWGDNRSGQSNAPAGEFLAVSAGGSQSCAIRVDGSVSCWGSGHDGSTRALDGFFRAVSAGYGPVCGLRTDGTVACRGGGGVSATSDGLFKAVTSGFFFSCAAPSDGAVTCWPSRDAGESDAPDEPLVSLSAGSSHVCGLRSDATIACWGNNFDGQSDAPGGRFREVSAGGEHTCGLREDRTIACWGNGHSGRTNAPRGEFEAVAAGGTHTCGLRPIGTVVCWGETADDRSRPPSGQFAEVSAGGEHTCGLLATMTIECWGHDEGGRAHPPPGEFTAVDAGSNQTCGLRTDSTLVCWGESSVVGPRAPDGHFNAVSVGGSSSCGLRTDSTVVCWGQSPVPETVPSGSFEAITAGTAHACALRADGSVTCWGENQFGETETPDGRFTAISAGLWYSCGLRTDTSIVCWGDNPAMDSSVPAGSFTAVSAGPLHVCALRSDESVICWGNNRRGESDPPAGRFRAVSAGESHSCGVRLDNSVACWGSETLVRPHGVRSPDAPGRPDPAACRPYGVSSFTTAGFPLHWSAAPSTGTVRVAVLLMDFPDAVAPISPHVEVGSNLEFAEQYLESASYGKLDIEFEVLERWLRSQNDYTHYLRGTRLAGHDLEAVEMAGADFDFTGFDIVMTVLPSAHFSGGTATGSAKTDEGVISSRVQINVHASPIRGLGFDEATEPQDWGWVAAHELLHALGLSDLYAVGGSVELIEEPPGKLRFWTRFGIMGLETDFLLDDDDPRIRTYRPRADGEMLAWSRWQLGWLDPDQVRCVTGDDAAVSLVSMATNPGSGTAMAAIPLTANEAIAIESRRNRGRDVSGLISEGVLVYEVNASIYSGNLPMKVIGVPDHGFPVLQVGDSVTVRGYTITVTADDGGTHTVRITRTVDG